MVKSWNDVAWISARLVIILTQCGQTSWLVWMSQACSVCCSMSSCRLCCRRCLILTSCQFVKRSSVTVAGVFRYATSKGSDSAVFHPQSSEQQWKLWNGPGLAGAAKSPAICVYSTSVHRTWSRPTPLPDGIWHGVITRCSLHRCRRWTRLTDTMRRTGNALQAAAHITSR